MSGRLGTTTLIVLLSFLAAGCAADPAKQSEVGLEIADESKLADVIRSHQGSVVLVDFWATWCTECVEILPHTVDLHRRFGDQGLAVISVSFDDPGVEPDVRRLLTEKGATFENFLSPYGVTPQAIKAFDIDDGALPHIRIYDRAGKLRRKFGVSTGPFTPEDVEGAVEEILNES